jgi:hypothetical protein
MRLEKQQATELRLWATGRLEALTETDPTILADYAVQLLNDDTPIEETRKHAAASLQDFLADGKSSLFLKASMRSSNMIAFQTLPNSLPNCS